MDRPISVSQLSNYIKSIFSHEEMLFNISIYGEISAISVTRGVVYFALKDDASLINCVCFDFELFKDVNNGDNVVVRGTPNYYSKTGKLSFVINKIEKNGAGDLYLRFLELKEKLQQEGLFDNKHKKQLPKNIVNIGVATSETGAVFHDIINVATRRNPLVNIFLEPCKVQGSDAEYDICRAIEKLDGKGFDVIIIARGGGSEQDLQAYNTEVLARKVFSLKTPVISAVGHETDFSLTDFVADLRAPTPSAAAELVTSELNLVVDNLIKNKDKLSNVYASFLKFKEERFLRNVSLINNITVNYLNKIDVKFKSLLRNFLSVDKNFINEKQYNFNLSVVGLENLNPSNFLNKGYVKIEKDGRGVISKDELTSKDNVAIIFKDGKLEAEIKG